MEIEEIEIEIDDQGKVTLHVKGIPGSACLAITSELEQVLGNVIMERQMTSEISNLNSTFQAAPDQHTRLQNK